MEHKNVCDVCYFKLIPTMEYGPLYPHDNIIKTEHNEAQSVSQNVSSRSSTKSCYNGGTYNGYYSSGFPRRRNMEHIQISRAVLTSMINLQPKRR